jgi:hypothetical protein
MHAIAEQNARKIRLQILNNTRVSLLYSSAELTKTIPALLPLSLCVICHCTIDPKQGLVPPCKHAVHKECIKKVILAYKRIQLKEQVYSCKEQGCQAKILVADLVARGIIHRDELVINRCVYCMIQVKEPAKEQVPYLKLQVCNHIIHLVCLQKLQLEKKKHCPHCNRDATPDLSTFHTKPFEKLKCEYCSQPIVSDKPARVLSCCQGAVHDQCLLSVVPGAQDTPKQCWKCNRGMSAADVANLEVQDTILCAICGKDCKGDHRKKSLPCTHPAHEQCLGIKPGEQLVTVKKCQQCGKEYACCPKCRSLVLSADCITLECNHICHKECYQQPQIWCPFCRRNKKKKI